MCRGFSRAAGLVVSSLLPGFLPASAGRSLRDDQSLEYTCCFGLHPWQDVLVGVDGEHRVAVTEPFTDNLDWYPGFDEQRAMGMTQVVVVPTSAQARLCRPGRYADLGWVGL